MNRASWISTLFSTILILLTGCTAKNLHNVSDSELRQLSEELFSYENPDFKKHIQVNLQGHEVRKPYSDLSLQPLLTVDSATLATPMLKHVHDLFDNYEISTLVEEIVSPDEYNEQENLLDDLLKTNSINRVMHFLSERNLIRNGNATYRDTLRDLWFSQFARQKKNKIVGSSGFEHMFLGELKYGQKLIGLHNWIFFNAAERAGLLNYWGYRHIKNFGNTTASVAQVVFFYSGQLKSSTIFIGTSPELDISLYTLCFFARPNRYCRLSMGGTKFGVQTYIVNHTGDKVSLGSAYPVC